MKKVIFVVGAILVVVLAYASGCGSSNDPSAATVDSATSATIPTQVDAQSAVQ